MLPVQHWTPRRPKSRLRSGDEPYNNAYPLFYCPQEYGKGVQCCSFGVEFQARKTVPGGECVRRLASNGCVLEAIRTKDTRSGAVLPATHHHSPPRLGHPAHRSCSGPFLQTRSSCGTILHPCPCLQPTCVSPRCNPDCHRSKNVHCLISAEIKTAVYLVSCCG